MTRLWDLSDYPASPPANPLNVVFIHHSCGGQLLALPGPESGTNGIYASHPNGGGLRALLEQNGYTVCEASYGSQIGQRTDIFDWLPKFRDQMERVVKCKSQDITSNHGHRNDIVVFKSCFPNNAFEGAGRAPGNPAGPELTVWNAKAAYMALLPVFEKWPEVLFICMTPPPLARCRQAPWRRFLNRIRSKSAAPGSSARLAREFNGWLAGKDGWLATRPTNVAVFDYYNLLTGHGASNFSLYPSDGGRDSHPNGNGNRIAAHSFLPFLNRVVNRSRMMVYLTVLFCLLAFGRVAEAQQQSLPRTENFVTPLPDGGATNVNGFFPVLRAAAALPQNPPPLEWGALGLYPHAAYRYLYEDGIQVRPGHAQNTGIQEFTPGLLLKAGDHWAADYTARESLYSNSEYRDSLDHSARLDGNYAIGNWQVGASQSYVAQSTPLIETAAQTSQERHLTDLQGACGLNSGMTLELGAAQDFRFAEGLVDSRQWSSMDWLNYELSSRLNSALGIGAGYVDVSAGSDMTYEHVQARLDYRLTERTSFLVRGGLEDRQFLGDNGRGDRLVPVFGASIGWQPCEQTRFSFVAERATDTSLFANELAESTLVRASVQQRVCRKAYLTLGGGYNTTKYVAAARTIFVNREDDYTTFDVRLACPVLKHGILAVFWQTSDISSSEPGFGHSRSQFGVEVGWRY